MVMLSSIFTIPLIGAVLTAVLGKSLSRGLVSAIYMLFSITTLGVVIKITSMFDTTQSGMQFAEHLFNFRISIDGISLLLIMLTAILFPLCIVSMQTIKTEQLATCIAMYLLLESIIMSVFIAEDVIFFYICFEAVLIPMFFIIGMWGGQNRVYATFKLFLYTLAGSVVFLIAILYLVTHYHTTNIQELMHVAPNLPLTIQKWLWLAFFVSFAIKIPMFPLHTWLPDAHVQAPTSGSVILAGVLIKIGAYGFLRFSLPMLPDASLHFAPTVIILSAIAVVYASFVAFAQEDMKKLIAYSSIAHMGFVTAGIFTFNEYGITGAIFQMLSHGIVSAALFMCVGMLYSRTHSLIIDKYSGIANAMPSFASMFMLFSMASIGLPGTSGFIGEFLSMLGIFHDSKFLSILIISGVVGGAVYMLSLCRRIIWGTGPSDSLSADIKVTEFISLVPLAILVILLGVYPKAVDRYLQPAVAQILSISQFHYNEDFKF